MAWKAAKNRKVLLLTGPRQVGKTYMARELGKTFKSFVEVNFEKDVDVKQFFEQNLDPDRICTSLSAYYGQPIVDGETLLFFDEIPSYPKAIQALRFFYEAKPGLHLIAAGSLLEFVLADLSSGEWDEYAPCLCIPCRLMNFCWQIIRRLCWNSRRMPHLRIH